MSDVMEEPEGATPLDPDELEGLRPRHVTTRAELNELEQANIDAGLLWLHRRRRHDVLTLDFLQLLHKQLFGKVWKWAGTFRRTEKTIGADPRHIGERTLGLLGDVRYWVANDTYSPIESALRFHHRLVAIHLFPNGNGRHARIAADALLGTAYRHKPIDWSGGQDLIQDSKRRRQYIEALRAADRQDIGPLLAFGGLRA